MFAERNSSKRHAGRLTIDDLLVITLLTTAAIEERIETCATHSNDDTTILIVVKLKVVAYAALTYDRHLHVIQVWRACDVC